MRVSAIADWTTCEAMALSDPRPEARVHVAAWVGTMAHGLLSDTEPSEGTFRAAFRCYYANGARGNGASSCHSRRS